MGEQVTTRMEVRATMRGAVGVQVRVRFAVGVTVRPQRGRLQGGSGRSCW